MDLSFLQTLATTLADLSLPVQIIGVLLLALSWHEAAHAWVADRLGDPTARQLGRVSLNPLRHLDPFLSFLLPLIMYMSVGIAFGGGKPVPINPSYFRHRTRDFMLVALAGPFSNLAMSLGFCLLYVAAAATGVLVDTIHNPVNGAVYTSTPSLASTMLGVLQGGELPVNVLESVLVLGVLINVVLAVFNLMPLPPLDGSRVIGWLLPERLAGSWYRLDRFGLIMVLVFFLMLDGFRYVAAVVVPVLAAYGELADEAVRLVA